MESNQNECSKDVIQTQIVNSLTKGESRPSLDEIKEVKARHKRHCYMRDGKQTSGSKNRDFRFLRHWFLCGVPTI